MKDNKSRVAINATFDHENPTGLGVYTHALVGALLKEECDYDFTVYSSSPVLKKMYPEKVTRVSPLTSPGLGFKGHLMRLLWQQTMLPFKSRRQNASLLCSTVPEGILFSPLKQIITMHDILPMKYPEMYPRMRYHFYYTVPLLLKKSRAVICPSENTKKDVITYYAIKDKPIYVISEGFNRQRFYPREKGVVQKRYGLENYLLYIGDMRPYKNLERSLEAFARLNLTDRSFVIGGKKNPRFYPGIEKKVDRLLLKNKVIFLGYVPEEDLPHLYSEAAAFVFPSLYEGFGLPPLEAMACGCPVVASNAASLSEVCGDAVRYVDPYDVESIARGIHEVLTDELMRQNLRAKGLERAELFSWERAAKEHLKIFEECLSKEKTEKSDTKWQ
jgi:glycosyltransferase involved in cell wall biosynthesis